MKRRPESAGARRKKRHRAGKAKHMAAAAASRLIWMSQAKGCPHICLFCKYYRQCREDGIPEKRR